jgi:hypothetical protein
MEIYAKTLRISQIEAALLLQLQETVPEDRTKKDWEFIDRILLNLVEKSSLLQRSRRPSFSFMKTYDDLKLLETLPKSELVKLAQQIGIAVNVRSGRKSGSKEHGKKS